MVYDVDIPSVLPVQVQNIGMIFSWSRSRIATDFRKYLLKIENDVDNISQTDSGLILDPKGKSIQWNGIKLIQVKFRLDSRKRLFTRN